MSKSKVDELTGDEGSAIESSSSGDAAEGQNTPGHDEFNAMRGLRENARVAMDALRDAGREASAAVTEIGGSAYQVGARTGAQIARKVEAQPMASVLVAASLGLVAGVLLSRR